MKKQILILYTILNFSAYGLYSTIEVLAIHNTFEKNILAFKKGHKDKFFFIGEE